MSSVAERIATRNKERKSNSKRSNKNWGAILKRKTLKWTAISAIVASSPYVAELSVTKYQENDIKKAVSYMVQNRAAQCDAGVPDSLSAQYQQKMNTVVQSELVSTKLDALNVKDIYKSGLKRIANAIPGKRTIAELAQEHAGFTVPKSYMRDDYQTKTGEFAEQARDLAEMGVSVCFDAGLSDHKLGSAFTASQALITLNPNLDDAVLSAHLSRQFNLAHQEFVKPFKTFASDMKDQKMHFSKITAMQEMANDILSPKTKTITQSGDPISAPIETTVKYKAKLKSLSQ